MKRSSNPQARRRTHNSHSYRSGFESKVHEDLLSRGVRVEYESERIEYRVPEAVRRYTPDFPLGNGIYVETKGYFDAADRQKHLYIKSSRPDIEVRFVFQRASTPIYKNSPTTYALWCQKHGFLWAEKRVPDEWLRGLA